MPFSARSKFAVPALAVVLGLGMGLPGQATAKPDPGPAPGPGADVGSDITSEGVTEYDAGRYVVVMSAPPAASYRGTRAPAGEQFNARSARARDYSKDLVAEQKDLAAEVGFTIDRSFTIAANGFTADLSAREATELAADRRVLVVEKDSLVQADTWNTPEFLGLTGQNGVWSEAGGRSKAGDGIVVGIIDSGMWPESASFDAPALTGNPQTPWDISIDGTATTMEKADGGVFHGECEMGEEWAATDCNQRIIGARYYVDGYGEDDVLDEDYLSARDGNGHGTHTASTAAGKFVKDVEVEGAEFGNLSGMAPAARVAVYKALWATEDGSASGATSDLVAAIEDATADGVDVINYSISGSQDTVLDAVEITFEGAAEAGVFIATSAGNSGPDASTVAHNSPWLTTVAASTHTAFENTLVLGNGKKIVGASIATDPVAEAPLVEALTVGNGELSDSDTSLCAPDSLDPAEAAGTIVICLRGTYDRVAKSAEVERAGGVGMVLLNPTPNSLDADFHAVPTVHVPDTAGARLDAYLEEAGDGATAEIKLGNLTNKVTPVPQIAGFSSRGPAQSDNSDLLKPDISAPGASVLAAVAPPSNFDRDYDLYSGTSMSAPHIAGLAAFIHGLHPRWTPMQIKSAMMTTAYNLKNDTGGRSTDLFAQGAGHVNPKKFLNPGLFVTTKANDWRGYITGLGLDTGVPAIEPKDLNMPSMAQGYVMSETSFTRTFRSTMVGEWDVSVNVPGFDATPSTSTLEAQRKGDTEQLTIDFVRTTAPLSEFAMGYVTLTGPTTVRLPVALRPVSVKAPETVGGTGTDGSVEVPITGGFTGDLAVSTKGLVKAQVGEGDIPEGDYTLECVTIGEGSELAQFDLHAPDETSDLDMYVYASESCDPADIYAVAGEAATPSPGETLTLTDPEPGSYIVEVDAFAAGDQGSPVPYSLRTYDLGGSPSVGDLTVDPNPVPVTTGGETSFDASWTALDPDAYYFGVLGYDGAPNPTYLYVDTHAGP